MTLTVKLSPALEERLRQRAALCGRTHSALMREALEDYLDRTEDGERKSAYELGKDLFGRHEGGSEDLSTQRRKYFADWVAAKHERRGT